MFWHANAVRAQRLRNNAAKLQSYGCYLDEQSSRDTVKATAPNNTLEFVEELRRKFGSVVRGWLLHLDPAQTGRISYTQFCNAVREMGYVGDISLLWSELDENASGFVTLDELDPVCLRLFEAFRDTCIHHFGGMDEAFRYGVDQTRTGTATVDELLAFCENFRAFPDVENLEETVEMLFKAFDLAGAGMLTSASIAFLDPKFGSWKGERFVMLKSCHTPVERQAMLSSGLAKASRQHQRFEGDRCIFCAACCQPNSALRVRCKNARCNKPLQDAYVGKGIPEQTPEWTHWNDADDNELLVSGGWIGASPERRSASSRRKHRMLSANSFVSSPVASGMKNHKRFASMGVEPATARQSPLGGTLPPLR
mmetsp:Transcript_11279/g.24952  ORF Transcript_11279/g.24952 Transcript_11279/m.24952 type:complete len:367 (+) Transcript_11279:20-1120(+)